jgi:hypothetical protein
MAVCTRCGEGYPEFCHQCLAEIAELTPAQEAADELLEAARQIGFWLDNISIYIHTNKEGVSRVDFCLDADQLQRDRRKLWAAIAKATGQEE